MKADDISTELDSFRDIQEDLDGVSLRLKKLGDIEGSLEKIKNLRFKIEEHSEWLDRLLKYKRSEENEKYN